jgi:hypothetical protein
MARSRAEPRGRPRGEAAGLREIAATLCGAHGLGWTDERAAGVSATMAEPERLVVRISAERRWPDDA